MALDKVSYSSDIPTEHAEAATRQQLIDQQKNLTAQLLYANSEVVRLNKELDERLKQLIGVYDELHHNKELLKAQYDMPVWIILHRKFLNFIDKQIAKIKE